MLCKTCEHPKSKHTGPAGHCTVKATHTGWTCPCDEYRQAIKARS